MAGEGAPERIWLQGWPRRLWVNLDRMTSWFCDDEASTEYIRADAAERALADARAAGIREALAAMTATETTMRQGRHHGEARGIRYAHVHVAALLTPKPEEPPHADPR